MERCDPAGGGLAEGFDLSAACEGCVWARAGARNRHWRTHLVGLDGDRVDFLRRCRSLGGRRRGRRGRQGSRRRRSRGILDSRIGRLRRRGGRAYARRKRPLPGDDRNGCNHARRRFRRLDIDRLLLARDQILGGPRIRCARLSRVIGLGIAVGRHDLVRTVTRLDDGRKRRQDRAAEHGAIAKRSSSSDNGQCEHGHDNEQSIPPARGRRLVEIVVGRVTLPVVVLGVVAFIFVVRIVMRGDCTTRCRPRG